MRLLLAALAVSVAVTLAEGNKLYCPERCNCTSADELEYSCNAGVDTVRFNAMNNEYVNVFCEGTNYSCADLPTINLGNDQPLSSVGITGCSPTIIPCLNEVLKTPSVGYLIVTDGVAPLEGQHVAQLGDVTDVRIVRGPEKTIPVSIIQALPTLRRLRITGSQGSQITLKSNDFENATQLEYLELSDGLLNGEIPEDAFKGLSKLTTLNIWGNNISEIGENSFRGLDSLQMLPLETSHISKMAAGSLTHLPKLTSFTMFRNELKELPPGLFTNLTLLKNIKIHYNIVPLKLHPHTFVNLTSLKSLTIENSGANLPENLLTGCEELLTISFSGNKITSLPPGFFKELKKLETLDLSRNRIASLPQGIFSPLKQLKSLNLNRNDLEVLPDFLFSGLRNLNKVTIDDNILTNISPLAFQGAIGLRTISLKSNKLTLKDPNGYSNFDEYSPFSTLVELKNLYLSGNEINTMFYDWRMVLTKLVNLDLYGNNFTFLDGLDCQFLSSNMKVDLRNNNISSIMLYGATISKENPLYKESPNSILLDDNPLLCDCGLYNLALRMTGLKPITAEPTFVLGEARCASPAKLNGKLFKNVPTNDLNCDVPPEHCFKSCSSCEIRPAISSLTYDCETLPPELPNPENFSLKHLSLKLGTAPQSLENLNLELLNLTNINLHEIPFSPSETVKALDLSNNKLRNIPIEFLNFNTTLYLSNNPFECDCSHSDELAQLKASSIVKDLDSIRCGDKLLISMDPSELCNTLRAATAAGVTFIILVLFVAVIGTVIYRNSHEILAFIIVKGLCPCCFVDDPDDKEYDVFVSYAHKDKKYIDKLMPKLENEFGLKTCVHYRDWFVGDFIPDQINRSVEKSRKTIILLSNNFLDSAYANMEFRAAHNLAMKEGKNRIVLILLEDVTTHEKLSEELKAHMKMNTFLKWDDSRFSEKLQKALPLRNNKKLVWPEVFKQAGEKTVKSGLDVQLNSDGKLVNIAVIDKDVV